MKGADVAFSLKGDFYYYEYVEKYHNYDIFTRFRTAEELERIILGSIAAEVECALEELMPLAQEGIEEVDESLLEQEVDYGYFIRRLMHILKMLKQEERLPAEQLTPAPPAASPADPPH